MTLPDDQLLFIDWCRTPVINASTCDSNSNLLNSSNIMIKGVSSKPSSQLPTLSHRFDVPEALRGTQKCLLGWMNAPHTRTSVPIAIYMHSFQHQARPIFPFF